MIGITYAIVIFIIEIALFLTEVILASRNKLNIRLKVTDTLEEADFINLKQGYKTSISIFRISLFVAYLVLVILYFDANKGNLLESVILYTIGGVLVYMLSLMNVKTFIFYSDYFIVSEPFNLFRKELLINYSGISQFRLFRALYNNFYLKLKMKNGDIISIQFSGSSVPKNFLILRMILNSKTGLKMEYMRKRWMRKKKEQNDQES